MDMTEIEREIRKLEADRTSWGNCEKLSILYAVRDHNETTSPPEYSFAASPPVATDVVGEYGDSIFLKEVAGRDSLKVWSLIDELMESERIINPRVFATVMQKLREI